MVFDDIFSNLVIRNSSYVTIHHNVKSRRGKQMFLDKPEYFVGKLGILVRTSYEPTVSVYCYE